jgi:hypothetical protein
MSSYSEVHCFLCGSKTNTTRNPLKETVGGNHLHKQCVNEARKIEPYTPSKLIPDFKKKPRKDKQA